MDISKTLFKEYSKCPLFCQMDSIYHNKCLANLSYDELELRELLGEMFNEDGNDLVHIPDEKQLALLPYYQETERLALQEASIIFNKKFEYFQKTTDQKCFSFNNEDHTFYTYVDGYNNDDNIIILEVKATTDRNLLQLGPKKNEKINSIFEKNRNIITLKKDLDDKQVIAYNKIFNRFNSIGKYFYDFAITRYFINQSLKNNKKKIDYYLVFLNSNYIYDGSTKNGENDFFSQEERLFSFIKANDILLSYNDIINQDYINICSYLKDKSKKKKIFKKACVNCLYKDTCFKELSQPFSITTLLNPKKVGKENYIDLINKGCVKIKDIPFVSLENKNHLIQRESIDNNKEIINVEQVKCELEKIHFPIYHLDFETFSSPIPRFFGEKPYSQSVFQFSIHVQRGLNDCNRYKDNYYYIPNDFSDHREDLIKKMIEIIKIKDNETVMVYNKTFECTRIQELMNIFPKYEKELLLIKNHIFDLKDVVKGRNVETINYYHPLLDGSYSIKKVLPLFSDLTYKSLDIHNGCEAVVAYSEFKYLPKEDIEELKKKLIEYCGLDTYSMVEIINNLYKKIQYYKRN